MLAMYEIANSQGRLVLVKTHWRLNTLLENHIMQTLRRPTTILSRTAFIVLLATLFGATTMGTRIFYKGPNRGTAVCNLAGNFLYEGVNKSKYILNIDGDKAWEGANKAKCLFNISGNNVYEGVNKAKVLFNIDGAKVWEGVNKAKCLFNCTADKMYEGVNQSAVAANWSGGALTKIETASLVYALMH